LPPNKVGDPLYKAVAELGGISRNTVARILDPLPQHGVNHSTLVLFFEAFGLQITDTDWTPLVVALPDVSVDLIIPSPGVRSELAIHKRLARILDLPTNGENFPSYSNASENLLDEELRRAGRAFKLGHKQEALNVVSMMWIQLSRFTPVGRYWAGKTGLLAGKLLRETGQYERSAELYQDVSDICSDSEPGIHVEALNGILLTEAMRCSGKLSHLRTIQSRVEAAIDGYYPQNMVYRRSNRLIRLNALCTLYRDAVTLELTDGPIGISTKLVLTDTMKKFLSMKEEIYDPYIRARNAEVSARLYTYAGMLQKAQEQLEESERHIINLVGEVYTVDAVRFQRVRAMMLAREGQYDEANAIAHNSLLSCRKHGFVNFENKMIGFSARLPYLFRTP